MTTSTDIRNRFFAALGNALTQYGFPAKMAPRTYNYVQETPCGHIGIFVNPIRHGDEIQFSLRCGISIRSIQEVLVKTELYVKDARGLTWTCGLLLDNLEKYKDWIFPLGPVRGALLSVGLGPRKGAFKGYDDAYMSVTADDVTVAHHVDRLIKLIDAYCWPFLKAYGFSESDFLMLCQRNDDFADVCFTRLEQQVLAGLILAEKLGREDAVVAIKNLAKSKGGYYARNGNPRPLEVIRRAGGELGLFE